VGSNNSFKVKLDKIRKTRMGFFMDSALSAKPLGSWREDPVRPHKVSYRVSYLQKHIPVTVFLKDFII